MKTSIWSKCEDVPEIKPGMVVEVMNFNGDLSVFVLVQTERGLCWTGLYSSVMRDQNAFAFYTSATIPSKTNIVNTVWKNIADYFQERSFEAMNKVM